MSLFTYNYGQAEGIAAIVSAAGVVTLYTAGKRQAIIHNIRVALAGSSATTSLALSLFDGTMAYQIMAPRFLAAYEVYRDNDPIVLPLGWSLRAAKSAGDQVHITGVVIEQAGS